MNKLTKYTLTYSIVATVVAVLMTYNTVQLIGTNEVTLFNECEVLDLDSAVRGMTIEETNKLMIVVAETLTESYKEETRERVEREHEEIANKMALGHMNDVMGVLIKSMGDMPTSTVSN